MWWAVALRGLNPENVAGHPRPLVCLSSKELKHLNAHFLVDDQRRWRPRCIGFFRNSWSLINRRADGRVLKIWSKCILRSKS